FVGDPAQQALEVPDRVRGLRERSDPRRLEPGPDDLVHHSVAEFLLAGEVVKERSLSQAGLVDDAVEAAGLEAVAVELLEGGPEDELSGCFRGLGLFHGISTIPTGWYEVNTPFAPRLCPHLLRHVRLDRRASLRRAPTVARKSVQSRHPTPRAARA